MAAALSTSRRLKRRWEPPPFAAVGHVEHSAARQLAHSLGDDVVLSMVDSPSSSGPDGPLRSMNLESRGAKYGEGSLDLLS
jgi:hypothetical protein